MCPIATAHAAGPGWAAILGGTDYAAAVATDPQGNIYVAGSTSSPDFQVTPRSTCRRHRTRLSAR
jgi:hypothetical protein